MRPVRNTITLSLLLTGLAGCGQPDAMIDIEPGVSLELANHRRATLSDINYRLHFAIPGVRQDPIQASATIAFTLSDNSAPLVLDFREREDNILRVRSNGTDSDFSVQREHLLIPAAELEVGENSIGIEFIAGETSLNRNPDYLYTLFVPDRARTAFPLFDQPNLKATYELTLTVPAQWNAVANAPLLATVDRGAHKDLRFARSDLISSYLFAFVAGNFQTVTRNVNGREMTMLHRESDEQKVARNLDAVFELHGAALDWLEYYTGIPYPFQKFDFALIPGFQYGGMEHVGAIQYRADSLFLDESPSKTQLLGRASLISHETAHMWFGNLVTMDWFDDVWTKEVFANFMAARIVNPGFPEIDHELNFLLRHYPGAYAVDRTGGANPIRQDLPNLNEAGTLYGGIIYNKAPIMMRQLELLMGESNFQAGMREYLATYAHGNATWPDLIAILDRKTGEDLVSWSQVWVNTAGRPEFALQSPAGTPSLIQQDSAGSGRVWPQRFSLAFDNGRAWISRDLNSNSVETRLGAGLQTGAENPLLFNADGRGYGLFPVQAELLAAWSDLSELQRGSLLISLYENMLEGRAITPAAYLRELITISGSEDNQLLLDLALGQMGRIYWIFLTEAERTAVNAELEQTLWSSVLSAPESSRKKIHFDAYRNIALSAGALDRLTAIWSEDLTVAGLTLSENDFIALATDLAIKLPDRADAIMNEQLERIGNADRRRRFQWMTPALSGRQQIRGEFFLSLQDAGNREIESWVLGALNALHHPLRHDVSEEYLQPSLELLEEIQVSGDIFFPARWLDAGFGNYNSPGAARTVREFLAQRPDYNRQLRMKILQSADILFRAERLRRQ